MAASGTDSNYNLSFLPGSLDIAKAALTATGNSRAVTYTGANQSVSGFTAAGLQGSDTLADLSSVAAAGATAKNAGSYANTVTAGTETNYTVSTVPGSLTIAKANATVTANSASVTYNGGNQSVPEAVVAPAQDANVSVSVTLPDRQPLPSWIRYDASTQSLITTAVPAGAFPIAVLINVGSQSTVVQISESTSGR